MEIGTNPDEGERFLFFVFSHFLSDSNDIFMAFSITFIILKL